METNSRLTAIAHDFRDSGWDRLMDPDGRMVPWPRLFHALRASRETELANDYQIHVVTAS